MYTKSVTALRVSTSFESIPLRAIRSAGHKSVETQISTSQVADEQVLESHEASSRTCSEFMHVSGHAQTHPLHSSLLEDCKIFSDSYMPNGISRSWFLEDSDEDCDGDSFEDFDRSFNQDLDRDTKTLGASTDLDEYYLDRNDDDSRILPGVKPSTDPGNHETNASSNSTSDVFSSATSCYTGATLSPSNIGQPLTPLISELVDFHLDATDDTYFHNAVPDADNSASAQRVESHCVRSCSTPLTLTMPPRRTKLARSEGQQSGQALVEAWNDGAAERKTKLQELIDDVGYLGDVIV